MPSLGSSVDCGNYHSTIFFFPLTFYDDRNPLLTYLGIHSDLDFTIVCLVNTTVKRMSNNCIMIVKYESYSSI